MSAPIVDAQGNRLVQAKGGHLRHVLPAGTRVALCGHEPLGQHNHFSRAGWWAVRYSYKGPHVGQNITCRKCQQAYTNQIL